MMSAMLPSSLPALHLDGRASLSDLGHLTALSCVSTWQSSPAESCHTCLLCECFHSLALCMGHRPRIMRRHSCVDCSVQVPKISALHMRRHSFLKSVLLWAMRIACQPHMSSLPLWLLWPSSKPLCWTSGIMLRHMMRTPRRSCCTTTPCSLCRLVSPSLFCVVLTDVSLLLHYLRTSIVCLMKSHFFIVDLIPPCCMNKSSGP